MQAEESNGDKSGIIPSYDNEGNLISLEILDASTRVGDALTKIKTLIPSYIRKSYLCWRIPTLNTKTVMTLLAVAILTTGCSTAKTRDKQETRPSDGMPKVSIADKCFGVSLSYGYDQLPERAFALAQQAGIGWGRSVLNWNDIEPDRGRHDWSTLDRIVGLARSHNLKMVGGLGYATSWNTTAPAEERSKGRRLDYPPADIEAWKRYVADTVMRYKDVVRAWEVWNEPDLGAFWNGTPAQYARLRAVTYDTVKRADPNARVLLGGLAMGGKKLNPTFLDDILADPNYPAAQYFDVAVFHHYGPRSEADRRMNYVKTSLERACASSKAIWITETGYTSNSSAQDLADYKGGPQAQARWLGDTIPHLYELGARCVFWFQLMDNPRQGPNGASMGLLDANAEPKPSYYALEG